MDKYKINQNFEKGGAIIKNNFDFQKGKSMILNVLTVEIRNFKPLIFADMENKPKIKKGDFMKKKGENQ